MKKTIIIPVLACFALAVTFTSCKKSSSPAPSTPTTTTSSPSPAVGSVDGTLVSLKTDVVTVAAGIPFAVSTESGLATFFTTTGASTFTDGGTVSVNGTNLDKQSNNSYLKTASMGMTPSTLSFSTGSNWSVGGAGSVPAFTYNHTVAFPTFTGSLPDSVVRSAGITVSLSGLVTGADSVILFIAAGSTYKTKTVAGTATSVSLSAADLSSLSAVSNQSAVLEVVPYKVTLSAQGGKNYAFIKEYAMVRNINIL